MAKRPKQSQVSEVEEAYGRLRSHLRKHGKIRNIQAAQLLKVSKDDSRGILAKLAEIGTLVAASDENEVIWYFSNEEGFYSDSERLVNLIPQTEQTRITDQVNGELRWIQSLSRDSLRRSTGHSRVQLPRGGSRLFRGPGPHEAEAGIVFPV